MCLLIKRSRFKDRGNKGEEILDVKRNVPLLETKNRVGSLIYGKVHYESIKLPRSGVNYQCLAIKINGTKRPREL